MVWVEPPAFECGQDQGDSDRRPPEHPKRGDGGGGELQVPGCTHRQQTELEDQHRGWRQKGGEQTLRPELSEGLDISSPLLLGLCSLLWSTGEAASEPVNLTQWKLWWRGGCGTYLFWTTLTTFSTRRWTGNRAPSGTHRVSTTPTKTHAGIPSCPVQ